MTDETNNNLQVMDVAFRGNCENLTPEITIIPAKAENTQKVTERKNFRAAAYCRVSTDSEEQLESYENQIAVYTKMINETPNWKKAA